jgi:hypothetical protein
MTGAGRQRGDLPRQLSVTKVRPLVSPRYLSLVCHYWRSIGYAAESLWNRILVTSQELPSSIVREDRPELLLSASRRVLLSKLTHIKLERSACAGDALLKEVK